MKRKKEKKKGSQHGNIASILCVYVSVAEYLCPAEGVSEVLSEIAIT